MKRITFMIVALLTQVGIALADGRIFANEVTIVSGGTATLDIQFTTADKEFCNFQFNLELADGLSLTEDEEGYVDFEDGGRFPKRNWTLNIQKQAMGNTYVVLYSNSNLTPLSGTEGTLIKLTLKADANLTEGSLPCSINSVVLSRPEGTKMQPADEPFNVIVSGTTGISEMSKKDKETTTVYDLSGRQVTGQLKKGVYVVAGRKILVKK